MNANGTSQLKRTHTSYPRGGLHLKSTEARLLEEYAEDVALTPRQTRLLCRNASKEISALQSQVNDIRKLAERAVRGCTDAECRAVLKNVVRLAKQH